jgi:hypothetical protein
MQKIMIKEKQNLRLKENLKRGTKIIIFNLGLILEALSRIQSQHRDIANNNFQNQHRFESIQIMRGLKSKSHLF